MNAAAEFIDSTLQLEGSEERAAVSALRIGGGLRFYGASVGAVRGTVRDALRRYRGLTRDDVIALASELWSVPVFERRLAAIVLMQGQVPVLVGNDLTRLEQFLREAQVPELIEPLTNDVVRPLLAQLPDAEATRAEKVVTRWRSESHPALRRAASLL